MQAQTLADEVRFSLAGLAYAAVTGITVYAAGHVRRHVSPRMRLILSRIAGILLTAIAVTLLASGGTRLVVSVLRDLDTFWFRISLRIGDQNCALLRSGSK